MSDIIKIWVPSWRTECGIAEYTAHIKEKLELNNVEVMAIPPDLGSVDLVHIQHAHKIIEDHVVNDYLERAQHKGVKTVITQHRVKPYASVWETKVNCMVTLTNHGTEKIKSRLPEVTTTTIPCGCPTWFPPRKKERGRVIGLFGFLKFHKGFFEVLDVLQKLPDTQLVIYSYPKSSDAEETWAEKSADLPIRRIKDFLPISEIAQRLAMEADVLIYWYEDTVDATASGAVRVGLATGVPVLTSSTQWFHELQDVTYQPDDLVEGTERLLEDSSLRRDICAAAYDYCHQYSWHRIAETHIDLWQSMLDAPIS